MTNMIQITHFKDARTTLSKYIKYPINKLLVLGCGTLGHERFIEANHVLAIEWCDERIKEVRKYDEVIPLKYDFSDIEKILVEKSFDTVIMFDALEHLEKEPAMKLLTNIEKYIKKQILIFIPIQKAIDNLERVRSIQKRHKLENKPLGNHLSIWNPQEFDELGYEVEVASLYHQKTKGYGAMICVKNL